MSSDVASCLHFMVEKALRFKPGLPVRLQREEPEQAKPHRKCNRLQSKKHKAGIAALSTSFGDRVLEVEKPCFSVNVIAYNLAAACLEAAPRYPKRSLNYAWFRHYP
jgi:hypothetical protein